MTISVPLTQVDGTNTHDGQTIKAVQSSAHSNCPVFRLYEFSRNEHSFIIEERGAHNVIVDTLEFL